MKQPHILFAILLQLTLIFSAFAQTSPTSFGQRFSLEAFGGPLYVPARANQELRTSLDYIESTELGFTTGLLVGFRLHDMFEARLGMQYTQYTVSANHSCEVCDLAQPLILPVALRMPEATFQLAVTPIRKRVELSTFLGFTAGFPIEPDYSEFIIASYEPTRNQYSIDGGLGAAINITDYIAFTMRGRFRYGLRQWEPSLKHDFRSIEATTGLRFRFGV